MVCDVKQEEVLSDGALLKIADASSTGDGFDNLALEGTGFFLLSFEHPIVCGCAEVEIERR